MNSSLKIALSIVFGGVLVTGFQNCSNQVDFDTRNSPQTMQSLVALDQNGDPTGEVPSPAPSPDPAPAPAPSPAPAPNPDPAPAPQPHPGSCEVVGCILDYGHGQSAKLGLLSGKLDSLNSRAESVCIPKDVCLKEISEAFQVPTFVASGSQGFCKSKKHLSTEEVHNLLNQNQNP